MVGMAALAASTTGASDSDLLLFELTRDYRIVLPLMAAVGLSGLVERIQPNSTSRANLQLGLNVQKDQQTEILPQILVAEAMHQSPLMLPAALPVLQAGLAMTRVVAAVVIDEAEHLVGIVTLKILTELFLLGTVCDRQRRSTRLRT